MQAQKEHELEHEWVLWSDASGSMTQQQQQQQQRTASEWSQLVRPVCGVKTAEAFWAVVDRLPLASELGPGTNLYFFQRGIEPAWEDPANAGGGRWSLVSSPSTSLDTAWLNTLLAVIGEQLGDCVCGACLNVKAGHVRVSIWLAHTTKQSTLETGIAWKASLSLPGNATVNWQLHGESGSPRIRI